jgi:hypothetical protein
MYRRIPLRKPTARFHCLENRFQSGFAAFFTKKKFGTSYQFHIKSRAIDATSLVSRSQNRSTIRKENAE